jgi:NADH-quinone oxidoreductase subunit N
MNWLSIYPEIALLIMACVVTLLDLFVRDPMRRPTYWVTQLSLAVVAAMHFADFSAGLTVYAMDRMVVSDPLGHLLGFFACIAVIAVLVYSRAHAAQREMLNGEFFSLAMFSLLGILVMLSANNFLVIYLGLELMSLSLYALVALRRDHPPATEAAMKFFVLGALASGFLLYGLSMMYGATGSLDIPEVFKAIASGQINKTVLAFGLVFIVAGLAFKLSAVPFHMWVPDVYDGAPTPVTLLIGCAPEFAAFAITFRLLVEGMSGLAVDWQQMLIVVSIGSMALGNIAAIAQTNIKRMLAYSAIAHMGFMLLGFTPTVIEGNTYSAANGYSSALFYVVVYVFTTLGAFATILLLSRRGFEADRIDDFKGLSRRNPWFAGVMSLFMFSLAGVPPTVGFYAKLAVLQSIVTTNQPGYIALAVFAVLMSLVGAFYYIRIVKVMYFDEPADSAPIVAATDVRALLSLNGAAIVLFGILPGGLMALCTQAIVRALAT